jgi:hypothetical protein
MKILRPKIISVLKDIIDIMIPFESWESKLKLLSVEDTCYPLYKKYSDYGLKLEVQLILYVVWDDLTESQCVFGAVKVVRSDKPILEYRELYFIVSIFRARTLWKELVTVGFALEDQSLNIKPALYNPLPLEELFL